MDFPQTAVLLLLLATGHHGYGNLPQVSPFFFLCNYHGKVQELGQATGEVKLSVSIVGHPDTYVPGQFYQVTVASSLNFDAFLLTGLYSISSPALAQARALGLQAGQPVGQNLMCSVVHSHLSHQPVHQFNFIWIAPPPGTGCVSFLASATLEQQLLFKDTEVLQLCEEGVQSTAPLRPELAEIHSDSIIFREDFDTQQGAFVQSTAPLRPELAEIHSDSIIFREDFDTQQGAFGVDLWSSHTGGHVGDKCGSVFYGDAAYFCDKSGPRQLVTVPLNTTSAAVLQFTIGKGTCDGSDTDQDIVVSFGLNGCQDWYELDRLRPPSLSDDTQEQVLVHLPTKARGPGICFAWKQAENPLIPKPLNNPNTNPNTGTSTNTKVSLTGVVESPKTGGETYDTDTAASKTTTTTIKTTTTAKPQTTTTAKLQTTTTPKPQTTTEEEAETTTMPGYPSIDYESFKIAEPDPADQPFNDDPLLGTKFKTGAGSWSKTGVKQGAGGDAGEEAVGLHGGCWVIDHVVVVNTAHTPDTMQADFSPVDPGEWLEFPGAYFKGAGGDAGEEAVGLHGGCWVIDHLVVVNTAHTPDTMQADFSPVDPGEWLEFPGAYFKHQCHSDDLAMVFNNDFNNTSATTRDLDLAPADVTPDLILHEEFEGSSPPGWIVSGGHSDQTCGVIHSANAMVFDAPGKSRKICTPFINTRHAGNVRFYFGFGVGGCDGSETDKTEVLVYVEDEHENTMYIVEKLNPASYRDPRLVSIPLNSEDRRDQARICWLQKYSGGAGKNVWALDGVQVLPHLPHVAQVNADKMAQFRLNLKCGNYPENNQIGMAYSTNFGETWHPLHQHCLPQQCTGEYFPTETIYNARDFDSWKRVTVPVPYAAMVPYVRFKWSKTNKDNPNWAMDDVYFGTCPEGCNGHGSCTKTGCHCDFRYTGPTCKDTISPNPTVLVETFQGANLHLSSTVESVRGASLGYKCGVVSTDGAVVFNQDGPREFVTGELNTTVNNYLQFNIRVGSNSPVNDCPPPDQTKELVVLDYSCDGGVHWHMLKQFNIFDYRTPKSDSVLLPTGARDTGCKFRWWQPEHSGPGRDVWALDDLSLNDQLFNTLHMHMGNFFQVGERLTFTHGKLSDTYCRAMKSLSFIGPYKTDDFRFFTTESMHVGPGYVMEFDLVMGCGLPYSENLDNRLYLEYSLDHGGHWSLVHDTCLPPGPCTEVTQGTIYDWTQFKDWQRVTVPLPVTTWGPATRFRMRQVEWSNTDTWAISRLYIGQQCPNMCQGQGMCADGDCVCDVGFEGEDCHPATHLDDKMQADFGMRYEPDTDFLHWRGGKVVSSNQGCGNIHADESMYFYDNGVRELITKDMDTRKADYIQYFIRIGGGDRDCNGAERRSEGVILQYSNNGGITWHMMEEMVNTKFGKPSLMSAELPAEAKTPSTRFRWWQPEHDGKGTDQWAVDEVILGKYHNLRSLEDDFNGSVEPLDSEQWMTVAGGVIGKYCNSQNPVLILANQEADKKVISHDLHLQDGDVISFKINVGCSNIWRWDHPVMLQYWPKGGSGYHLVQEPCYPQMDCPEGTNQEGSVYHSGPHGHWQLVVIPVTKELAKHPIILRWFQPGGYQFNFALDDVYIGPPCDESCHRNGPCKKGACVCEIDTHDINCQSDDPTPYGMVDRFEQLHRPSDFWSRIWGGHLGAGCGTVDKGKAMFFNGDGVREAVTKPMNTTYLRMLEFVVMIGSIRPYHRCVQPSSPNEAVILDYSVDNEISWHPLKVILPKEQGGTHERVTLELPKEAKTDRTIFRLWQPLGYGGMQRAEWGFDSFALGVNDTNYDGFQDDFAGMMPDMFTWFQSESAVPRITCHSKGNALEFSRNGESRFAETWDYRVTPSTFLQFEIAMDCDSLYNTLYGVTLEYSSNMGKSWHPVVEECGPPDFQCNGYQAMSDYMSDQHRNWTRISVPLPVGAQSPATRFRWRQHSQTPSGNVWALDNVYLGSGCPWLCSGHGHCDKGTCVCDIDYEGEHCVTSKPLPMMLRDDFNRDDPLNDNWSEIYGGHLNTMCGKLVSGNALTFSEDHVRMAVTRDIDTTMLETVEFYFLYGCNGKPMPWPRNESVLLQYSTNGGIVWNLIKELHYRNESGPRFFSLELPVKAKYNSTRFRFWQPANSGKMLSTWAVDNLFIGRMMMNPSSMQDDFENGVQSDSWLFVNDGKVGPYCERNTRNDTEGAGESALVFHHSSDSGQNSIVTRDLDVGPMSVLQFDINVGCASDATEKYPVRLEYSADGGLTWNLLVPNCAEISYAICHDSVTPATLYYGGTSKYWRRVSIPLDKLYVCGSLRFRWIQGFIPANDYGPEWALDNIFIGMACMQHCLGKGECGDTMMCTCDSGYAGDTCGPSDPKPNYLKEGFPLSDGPNNLPEHLLQLDSFIKADRFLDEDKWDVWGGAVVSKNCDLLVDQDSLVFQNPGERTLVTRELDLSKATFVQFYLRLGCGANQPDPATPPVYTQYTTNGGINWHTIEQFDFNLGNHEPFYVVLNMPEKARSPATQLRWWQPSKDGTFMEDWALDEIYIGGDYDGVPMMADEPTGPRDRIWTMNPGGVIEEVCGTTDHTAIHFTGDELHRFGVSVDAMVTEGTFLQFDLTMGCTPSKHCFYVDIEYSLDKGISWQPVYEDCLFSNVDCNHHFFPRSAMHSDMNTGWNRYTLPLPFYTRSKETRFRWYQKEGYDVQDQWAVANLYIGTDCLGWCNGHGHCSEAGCSCDAGWSGDQCEVMDAPLPEYLYDMFEEEIGLQGGDWLKIEGGRHEPGFCADGKTRLPASGNALHFVGNCSRMLFSKFLDLSEAVFVQFYFMYGCIDPPEHLDKSVLISYSPDGIVQTNMGHLHFGNYKQPTFVTFPLPEAARKNGMQIVFQQLVHDGYEHDDWIIDNMRVGGQQHNPDTMVSDFTDGTDPAEWNMFDNIKTDDYCDWKDVAIGDSFTQEAKIITQDLEIHEGHMLQFWYNVGCMRPWNKTAAPIHLKFSTDYGMTWSYLVPQCLTNEPQCPHGASQASVYYGDPMGRWQRVTMPLEGMTNSKATRFRWEQHPVSDLEAVTDFGLRDVYIGPQCEELCGGHGDCHPDKHPACHCDAGYLDRNCHAWKVKNPAEIKDTFTDPAIDKSNWLLVQGGTVQKPCSKIVEGTALAEIKDTFTDPAIDKSNWLLVQGGTVQKPCSKIVEGTALVQNGPGLRQVVTIDMDLRDAKFVQYSATIGGQNESPCCFKPYLHAHSVILQYSTDGGIHWTTLHTLDYTGYVRPRRDYIELPQEARTPATRIRWWQPLSMDPKHPQPCWALDDVYIGGHEINPAALEIQFNQTLPQKDQSWEFHPHGRVETEVCKSDDTVVHWKEGTGNRHFTTKQMIVQSNYILQFKISVGCSQSFNICVPHTPVRLVFNKDPHVNDWRDLVSLCLPDLTPGGDCAPNMFHAASQYSPDRHPTWTRITIRLTEKTFSSTTRFRWIQDSPDGDAPDWALNDIYVGESCPDMCHGRGDCKGGHCHCDEKYSGLSCMPAKQQLTRMFESFEGGVYKSHWDWVSGGDIGFGCGALLPYAHGKTLYFNGCGQREARTVEMDLRRASKVMFVLQIGCKAQTPECNIKTTDQSEYRGILLQYSTNQGADWHLIARHDPSDHLTPKRLAYDIPVAARKAGVQFRWWQPVHGGQGFDQWAMDHVEIVSGRASNKYHRRRRSVPSLAEQQ